MKTIFGCILIHLASLASAWATPLEDGLTLSQYTTVIDHYFMPLFDRLNGSPRPKIEHLAVVLLRSDHTINQLREAYKSAGHNLLFEKKEAINFEVQPYLHKQTERRAHVVVIFVIERSKDVVRVGVSGSVSPLGGDTRHLELEKKGSTWSVISDKVVTTS